MNFFPLEALESFHFHDVEKNNNAEKMEVHKANYLKHLNRVLGFNKVRTG